ncbi:ABC transporter permease [Bosea psychrotolerans]|uniref:Peptide/nickel transport system permease protein n=1 Tax=Bosea psychrotolerans TaxID=1871628 RepID=A0A2S4LX50_9HYPH|nr:ABC transporter permease [Bosea psychrotolerans]POR46955.1 peptide/nickel transport system permease protein [Bosea psychrotolerans]
MARYLFQRLLATAPVMLTVLAIVFLLLHIGPGDPAAAMAGDNASPEQITQIRQRLHLDQPLPVQFLIYLRQLAQFDLGVSVYSGRPVATMILQRAEPTLMLALTTSLLSVLLAVPAGVFAARRLGRATDYLVMGLSVAGFSVPVFVVGYALIQLFAIELGWLPVQGYRPLASGAWNTLRSLTLPTVALTFLFAALVARITRATMLNVLSEDYIRTARAKGVPDGRILMVHALKNIGVPVVTVVGTSFAALLGGVVVTESVFNIPGIGRLTVDAILARDYPVVQGVMLVFAVVLVLVNVLVDLSYALFDPRIRQGER